MKEIIIVVDKRYHLRNEYLGIKNILQKCREIIDDRDHLLEIQKMLFEEV